MEPEELGPWLDAYERFLGHRPILALDPVSGAPTLTFHALEGELWSKMMGSVERFQKKPRMMEHLARLGFKAGASGAILTVPTPSAFPPLLREIGFSDHGFLPCCMRIDVLDLPAAVWLEHLMRGRVPIPLASRRFYENRIGPSATPGALTPAFVLLRKSAWWRGRLTKHLFYVLHDMTKHVLTLHLVPGPCVRDLSSRAAALLAERRLAGLDAPAWLTRGLTPPPMLRFYENDLLAYSHRVWEFAREPSEFVSLFEEPSNYRQLLDALESRVEESNAAWPLLDDLRPTKTFALARRA